MKNRTFQAAKLRKNCRKLDVALRQFTGDRLTEEQRSLISSTLGPRSQYWIQVYRTADGLRRALNRHANTADIQLLFGGLETQTSAPAALIARSGSGRTAKVVYIYLPTEMEGNWDGSRSKKSN